MHTSLRNHFLISMPSLVDGSFAHSVTYLCEHDHQGAMGIIINHPLKLTLGNIFTQLNIDGTNHSNAPVLSGGPVQTDRGFVLHSSGERWQSIVAISPEISLTTSRDILDDVAANRGPSHCLVALGYAGWSAGQLEHELAGNAWLTCPASTNIMFNTPFEQRINSALALMGIDIGRLSSQAGHA